MTKNTTHSAAIYWIRIIAIISKLDSHANNTIFHPVKSFESPSSLSEVKGNTGTDVLPVLGSITQHTY